VAAEAHSISGSMKRLIMIHLLTIFSGIIGIEKNAASGGRIHSANNDTDFGSLLLAVRIGLKQGISLHD